jgi:YhcN/YlaJ family sporulation lipoprotein
MEVANKASMEAGKVMGVNMATAIVSDKTIYIGLTMNANGDKTKSAAVEKNVMDKVKSMEPGYTVMVTSDMNTVASIKTVAEGVAQGKPMSSFTKEMDMIMMKMNPKGK